MKKITQSATTGGAPIYLDDFKDVFNDEIWDVIQAQFSAFDLDTEGIIVSGCDITGSVGNYTLSAGIVYIDGEFRRISQNTGLSLPQYIIPSTDVNTTRTFEDTVIKTLFVTKGAELDTSAPGSGQYIAITTVNDLDDRRYRNIVNNYKKRRFSIGDWNMDSDSFLIITNSTLSNIPIAQITDIAVRIFNDAGTASYDLSYRNHGYYQFGALGLTINRENAGFFDSTDFDATGYNRGYITIEWY